MFITRESDYAMRVIRALMWEPRLSVSEICERESITAPFAYKILKKLQNAGSWKDTAEFMAVTRWREIRKNCHYMRYTVRSIRICPSLSAWTAHISVQGTDRTEFPAMHMMSFRRSRISCGQCSVGNPWRIFSEKRRSDSRMWVGISVWDDKESSLERENSEQLFFICEKDNGVCTG